MKVRVITHGDRTNWSNPHLSDRKKAAIEMIRENLLPKIPKPPMVVIGTGTRFQETYAILAPALDGIPTKRSPFCGSADSLSLNKEYPVGQSPPDLTKIPEHISIQLADRTCVPRNDYLGLERSPGFHAWEFVGGFAPGTLFVAGGELMGALGFKSEEGRLYELDTEEKIVRQIE